MGCLRAVKGKTAVSCELCSYFPTIVTSIREGVGGCVGVMTRVHVYQFIGESTLLLVVPAPSFGPGHTPTAKLPA